MLGERRITPHIYYRKRLLRHALTDSWVPITQSGWIAISFPHVFPSFLQRLIKCMEILKARTYGWGNMRRQPGRRGIYSCVITHINPGVDQELEHTVPLLPAFIMTFWLGLHGLWKDTRPFPIVQCGVKIERKITRVNIDGRRGKIWSRSSCISSPNSPIWYGQSKELYSFLIPSQSEDKPNNIRTLRTSNYIDTFECTFPKFFSGWGIFGDKGLQARIFCWGPILTFFRPGTSSECTTVHLCCVLQFGRIFCIHSFFSWRLLTVTKTKKTNRKWGLPVQGTQKRPHCPWHFFREIHVYWHNITGC